MKSLLIVFGICAGSSLFADGSIEGKWGYSCFDSVDQNKKVFSSKGTLECATGVCKSELDYFDGKTCEGRATDHSSSSFKYEIEGRVDADQFNIKITDSVSSNACYGRIRIRDNNKLFFSKIPADGEANDCSTPEKRVTAIDENSIVNRI